MQNEPTIGIVFISGAGLGTTIWDAVKAQINLPSISVDYTALKSQSSLNKISLQQYVDVAAAQVNTLTTDKIVIVAHSIGGIVGIETAKQLRNKTIGFVGISAAIAAPKTSFVSLLPFPKNFITKIILKLAGTKPPEAAIKNGLCNDISAEQTQQIVAHFSPESLQLYTDQTTDLPIPSIPSLYLLTKKDNEYPVALQQKMATRLKNVHVEKIDTGHLPMISQPVVVAEKINTFLKGV